jgi:transposase
VDAVESEFGHGRTPSLVARLLDGEAMTDVCREFGVSRKTGYKIDDRYKEHGLEAPSDRSRRPVRYANQLPEQIEGLIVRLKAEKPHWRDWLKLENRCLVPVNSFVEYAPEPNPASWESAI